MSVERMESEQSSPSPTPASQRPPSRYSVVAELRRGARVPGSRPGSPRRSSAHSSPSRTPDSRSRPTSGSRSRPDEQAAPGDERLRPVPADVGLERQVEQPDDGGREERVARSRATKQAELPDREEVVRAAQPERHLEAEHDDGEPQRRHGGRPPAHVVAPGEQDRRGHDREQRRARSTATAGGLLAGRARVRLRAVGRSPGTDEMEEDRLALERGGLDAQRQARARPGPRPRRAGVRGGERRPARLRRLELAAVELGGGEQRVPVRRGRLRRGVRRLRRQHLEEVQPARASSPTFTIPARVAGGLQMPTMPGVSSSLLTSSASSRCGLVRYQ